ncbi:beta strand repeat-containing protein, partial [Bosea sp. Root483D1]|uniref:beta strand repeat-containing protein n=1 Tax=Bosea sp. Root483D1 TaxID=1736544 RepID=UPI00138F1B1A
MTICRLALLLGTTALMPLSADRARAACVFLGGADYQCTDDSGGTIIVGAPAANVNIGNTGADRNATFPSELTIFGTAINVTFATTTTPSSFNGNGGLVVSQSGPTSDAISVTGMNAVMNLAGGIGIEVNANTSGTTTIETVAGGTITTGGNGLEYRNAHITPGTLTITVGATITAGANNSALLIDTGGSSTLNVNADLQGAITYSGRTTGTVVINVGAGVTVSPTGIYQTIALNNVSDATVNNGGTIVAGASSLYTNSNTTLNNQASGTISSSATGYAFRQHGSGKTLIVDNAGTIVGTGFSVAGSTVSVINSGTWTANAASAFTGTATLANSGTFVSGAFTTALTSVTNSGSVNIQAGGTLSTTGGYIQSAGGTAVDGTLQGTVTLNGGQILGTGTIAGNLTANAGATVSPGGSTGTLAVTGNATFNAGSTYRVEIAGAAADLFTVTGTASLAGTIQLVAGGGSYSFNAPYTVLTAAGGRTGTFGNVTTVGSFGVGVTSEVSYTAKAVEVTLRPGSLVSAGSGGSGSPVSDWSSASGLSLNNWSVAAAIDRAVANGADPSFLYQIYARGDREALLAALRTLTGEV